MGICARTILQKRAKNDDFFGENFEKITKKSRKITKKMTEKSRFFTDVSAQNRMILTFWWKKYFFRGKNLSENLHKISGFTLFANSGGFRGGKTPLEKCKPGEKRGDLRGFSGGPAKSAGGEIWRILSNLADFWPIFVRISRFFILRKHGRTAETPGEISGGFRGVQLGPILGRYPPGKTPRFPGKNSPKYRTKT